VNPRHQEQQDAGTRATLIVTTWNMFVPTPALVGVRLIASLANQFAVSLSVIHNSLI